MTQIGRENIVSRVDGVLHVANEMSKADLILGLSGFPCMA